MATYRNRYKSKEDAARAAQIGETHAERLFGTSLGAPKAAREAWDKIENLREASEEADRTRREMAAQDIFNRAQKAVDGAKKASPKKYKSGGKVRGCGIATKGHGKGTMR